MKIVTANQIRSSSYIYGRSLGEEGPIALDWSGSGIRFAFKGPGEVNASFSIISNRHNTRFAIEVDGVLSRYAKVSRQTFLASFSDNKTHEIRIYKTSEAPDNIIDLNYLLISDSASIEKPRPNRGYKMEIIGDSISCANLLDRDNPEEEDAYRGYATRLGKAYGDNFSIVAVSGIGLMQGCDSTSQISRRNQMIDLWPKASFYRNRDAIWTPKEDTDIAIANLGNNDLDQERLEVLGTTINDFLGAVGQFHKVLRKAYPKAKIVFVYGSFANRDYIKEYREYIEGLKDESTFFIELPQCSGGDSSHPDEKEHDMLAAFISARLAPILGIRDPYVKRF